MTTQRSSFTRNLYSEALLQVPGVKHVTGSESVVSSGIADLDYILGGGFSLGTLAMIMEDSEAPHHLLLIRNFMSQGIAHNQPILYASPSKDPRAFLGTLPSPIISKGGRHEAVFDDDLGQGKDLRIAWQYKKYFGNQQIVGNVRDNSAQYCHDFDLRKHLDSESFLGQLIECIGIQDPSSLRLLHDRCSNFLSLFPRKDGGVGCAARIVLQSFSAPHCGFSSMDWEMLSFIRSLRSMLRSSNAVAVMTFPPSVLSPSFTKRLQHLADSLISIRAIADEDKGLAELLTGYKDMVGLLQIHKLARINTQVPAILDTSTFSIKLQKRRCVALERLNQAPIDGSGSHSYATSGSCGSSNTPSIDF